MTRSQLSTLIREIADTASKHSADIVMDNISKMDKDSFSFIDLYPSMMNAVEMFTVEVVFEVLSQTLPVTDE